MSRLVPLQPQSMRAALSCTRRRLFSVIPERPRPIADIAEYAAKRQTGVNMQVAQFLHHELPIRLAHRAIELEELPHGLSDMPSVQVVRDWYIESFNDLVAAKETNTPDEESRLIYGK
ncbi:branched-chain alpha-ketoacid dehydrogenase [Pavlovales sp. CCMP2436]|nr:branched-chain alpha-ketoacid dehydrogenase [Pavlovales sp. CCMP2436]